eukprot:403347545
MQSQLGKRKDSEQKSHHDDDTEQINTYTRDYTGTQMMPYFANDYEQRDQNDVLGGYSSSNSQQLQNVGTTVNQLNQVPHFEDELRYLYEFDLQKRLRLASPSSDGYDSSALVKPDMLKLKQDVSTRGSSNPLFEDDQDLFIKFSDQPNSNDDQSRMMIDQSENYKTSRVSADMYLNDDNLSDVSELSFDLQETQGHHTTPTAHQMQESLALTGDDKKNQLHEKHQEKLIDDWFNEISKRFQNGAEHEKQKDSNKIDIRSELPKSLVKFADNRKTQMTSRSDSLLEKQLCKDKLATKFPVFKDVTSSWSYNYDVEEKKRFKGELMWNPVAILKTSQVDEYLKTANQLYPKCTGLNEEIALKFLVQNDYKIDQAIMKLRTKECSYEIVKLINQVTQYDAKIEFLSQILKLQEQVL